MPRIRSHRASRSTVFSATAISPAPAPTSFPWAPGSPLSNAAVFPQRAVAGDLNYRGDLVFLDQARAQQTSRSLQVEDGWTYFIHGWTQVIAEVFDIDIPTSGPAFERLSEIAREAAGR